MTRTVYKAIPGLRVVPAGGFLLKSLSKIHTQNREIIRLKLGVAEFYLVIDPELIQEVLVTKQGNFVKGEYLQRTKKVFGEGLLTSEGDFHHRQRRLVLPALKDH
jgi:cytochrome P450